MTGCQVLAVEPRQTEIMATLSEQGAMLEELRSVVTLLTPETARADLRRLIVDENILHRSSLVSRRKLFEKLGRRYFRQQVPVATARFVRAVQNTQDPSQVGLLAYVMFLWNDALTFALGCEWLAPKLRSAPFEAHTGAAERELEFQSEGFPAMQTWSETTHRRIAQHYLSLLRHCGYATGAARKTLRRPFISADVVLFGVQLILGGGERADQIPGHPLLVAMGLSLEDTLGALADLNAHGRIRFVTQGGLVQLDLLEEAATQ